MWLLVAKRRKLPFDAESESRCKITITWSALSSKNRLMDHEPGHPLCCIKAPKPAFMSLVFLLPSHPSCLLLQSELAVYQSSHLFWTPMAVKCHRRGSYLKFRSRHKIHDENKSVAATRANDEEPTRTNGRMKSPTRTNDEALGPAEAIPHQLGAYGVTGRHFRGLFRWVLWP